MTEEQKCPACGGKGLPNSEFKHKYIHPVRQYVCQNLHCPQRDGAVAMYWEVYYKPHKRAIYIPHSFEMPQEEYFSK